MAASGDASTVGETGKFKPTLPTHILPAPEVRDLPEPPRRIARLIGPGVVGAGVGLASGEFIIWPHMAAQLGFTFLWGAALGVTLQWFLNMEVERYTLATGETALTGFSRHWRHWGLVFAIMVCVETVWPGWATGSATLFTYVFGGNPTVVACGMLLAIGAILTLAPVVYVALERLIVLKVVVIGLFFAVAIVFVIDADTWRALPTAVTHVGHVPTQLGFDVVMMAVAYAGAGGSQNLCQSNWVRDKGFGMGRYLPRLASPVTGVMQVQQTTGFVFEPTAQNMARWRRWWRFANLEQAFAFGAITVISITFTSMLAYSTLFGASGLPETADFLKTQGERMGDIAGGWFAVLFWAIGMFSLFAAAVGIIDVACRLTADVVKTLYLKKSSVQENKIYFGLVWAFVILGGMILFLGLDQPLVLLVISACVAGVAMFIYSILLLVMNRRALPKEIRTGPVRTVVLVFCVGFFGILSALIGWQQVTSLFS
ncbi:Nramp family divalent metal transporter [Streptomyces sp. NPDC002795]|uniref:Nramp family divalent metal transporter n=1 Tax=Streptomyces sp. NPDC002795 TaxID=3364665 RepID=UPI0036A7BB39